MKTSDEQGHVKVHVGFELSPEVAMIDSALKSGSSMSINLEISDYTSSSMHLLIDGSAEMQFDTDLFFTVGGSASTQYNLYELNTESTAVTVTMKFPGLSSVFIEPTELDEKQVGWYLAAPIREAANKVPDVSGFEFTTTKPELNFAEGGNFGLVNALIISQLPTITIKYSSGSASTYAQKLAVQENLEASFFGIGIAGQSLNYSSSEIKEHGHGEGFEITFEPPEPAGLATGQLAYVLGAGVTYPGAPTSRDR